jgi:TPR repeat protein
MFRRLIPALILLVAVPGAAGAQIAGGLRLEGVETCAQLSAFTARNPGFDSAMVASKREALGGCAPPPPRITPRPAPRPTPTPRPAPAPRAAPARPAPAPRVRPRAPTPSIPRTVPAPVPQPAPAPVPAPRPTPPVARPAPGITPRLNAPSLTPRLNTTVSPTTGLNAGIAPATTSLPTEVAGLAYSAPTDCRWNTAGNPPLLECLNENAVWRPVEDASITVSTVDNAARGDALAMANLGYFYDVQPAPIRNRTEAVRLYRGAADQGVAIAKYNLAVLYQSGVPGAIAPDPAEARRYLLEAADQGLAVAMRRLAEQADKSAGAGSKGDWYLRAAQAGDIPSMGKAAEFYRTGDGGLAQNPAAALDWARQADAHGDPWGRYILGLCFETGDGALTPDPAEAYRLFRMAADAGITPAMGKVGEYLYQGWGAVPRDDREALSWLDRAGRAGDARAQYYLALFHLDGLAGLTSDPVGAAALMLTSAQAGDVRAMFRTGRNYEVGIGVSPDIYEARRWYRRAADAGDPDARARLDFIGPY